MNEAISDAVFLKKFVIGEKSFKKNPSTFNRELKSYTLKIP
jgi:hypothetical protein